MRTYLKKKNSLPNGALCYLRGGGGAIIVSCLMTQYKINVTGLVDEAHVQTFYNNLIFIPTFALFYCARTFFAYHQVPSWIKKAICAFASSAFTVMLTESVFRALLRPVYTKLQPVIHSFPACVVWVLATYLAASTFALCLKHLPFIKKLL